MNVNIRHVQVMGCHYLPRSERSHLSVEDPAKPRGLLAETQDFFAVFELFALHKLAGVAVDLIGVVQSVEALEQVCGLSGCLQFLHSFRRPRPWWSGKNF